jgi:mono/diheme cytochrome c family protein
MSTESTRPSGPMSDEQLLRLHEQELESKPNDGGSYKLLPLGLLFFFSGLIFFGGTYLNRFSGHFSPGVFDERAKPHVGGIEVAKVDPIVLGKKQYDSLCVTCHQPTGLGLPGIYPPLAKSEWAQGSEERVIRIVLHGLTGPITVEGTTFPGAVPMPAVGPTGAGWSDDKIAAVLTYIRQEWGNKGAPITTEKVAEIRSKEGPHAAWTAPELEKIP